MFRTIFKIVCVLVILAGAFAAGRVYQYRASSQPVRLKLSKALPRAFVGLISAHGRVRDCADATSSEREILQQVASLYEANADDPNMLSLQIGLEKFLGHDLYRGPAGKGVFVCAPEDIYRGVGDFLSSKGFKGRLVEYQLNLAAKLPNPGKLIIGQVGNFAFNPTQQESAIVKGEDIRPAARMVLATFGKEANAFSEQAYKEMSADDSLGTGAAQVAAATGHPGTLDRIQSLMEGLLSSVPPEKPIPYEMKFRLYELAYAIYFTGPEAKNHLAPIRNLMARKVQSWAPPFGMLELPPTSLCDLVARIEDGAMNAYPICTDPKKVIDH
jgi:hypothetical protein